MAQNRHL